MIRIENSLILSRNQVHVSNIALAEALYINSARICRVGFFGSTMPIELAEPLIDNLVGRYLESLTPKLEARILHNKNVFDIEIVTPTESIELFHLVMIKGAQKNIAREECTRFTTSPLSACYLSGQ